MATERRLPFIQFYPADWRSDIGVRGLTAAARGFWMELLCLLHEGQPYGHLRLNGEVPTDRELAVLVAMTVGEVRRYRKQILTRQVASETADGVLYSRRMVRDSERRHKKREDGRRGGNPHLLHASRLDNQRVNPEVNHTDNQSDNPVDNHADNGVDKLHAREAQRPRDSETQSRTRTVVVGTSNGDGADSAVRARAGAFCQRYRWDLHPECRGTPYVPSRSVEESDFDSATRLCGAFDDAQVEQLARFFLEIPDDREKFLKGKRRSVTMLLNMAGPIAEKLGWGKTHARPA